MGYSFEIISKEKPITEEDYTKAFNNLSTWSKKGNTGHPICDIKYYPSYIRISGAFGLSGTIAEGFVLNMVINLIELGYIPKVLSGDWEYGTEEDQKWLEDNS